MRGKGLVEFYRADDISPIDQRVYMVAAEHLDHNCTSCEYDSSLPKAAHYLQEQNISGKRRLILAELQDMVKLRY